MLIKAVGQAVSCYAMSVVRIPISLCDYMEKAIAKFWWGSKDDKRCIHWAKWERMCKAKIKRGMGFPDFVCFNQALLAKQACRILQFPNSLVTKVLQARYFKQTNFLHAKLRSNPSYIWRSILWGKQVIHKGCRWRIGRGNNVQIYNSNWIPRGETFRPISILSLPTDSYVNELIGSDNKWDVTKIYQNFVKDDAELIVSIPLPKEPADDQLFWH